MIIHRRAHARLRSKFAAQRKCRILVVSPTDPLPLDVQFLQEFLGVKDHGYADVRDWQTSAGLSMRLLTQSFRHTLYRPCSLGIAQRSAVKLAKLASLSFKARVISAASETSTLEPPPAADEAVINNPALLLAAQQQHVSTNAVAKLPQVCMGFYLCCVVPA